MTGDQVAVRSDPLPIGRVLRAYGVESGFEILGALRTAGFAIPFVVVPLAVYILFGVVMAGGSESKSPYGPGIANYLFSGFSVMASIMPGIFSGVILAQEREGNLLRLKRAMPLPPGATIVAKVVMAVAIAALAVTLVAIAAVVAGEITLSLGQVAIIWGSLIVGTIPFAAIGLFIGSLVSGSAAPAYGNLVFLPMMWLSGLFIPLPKVLEPWAVIWPAFHLNQVALGLAGVDQFRFIPTAVAAGVLVGVTVLFGGVAVWRLARVG